jgi:hypothetical protein
MGVLGVGVAAGVLGRGNFGLGERLAQHTPLLVAELRNPRTQESLATVTLHGEEFIHAPLRGRTAWTTLRKRRRLALVPAEVAVTPVCAECGAVWMPNDSTRWRLRLDVEDELVWFCPSCDEREFGET